MKTKTTLLKLSLVALFLFITSASFAVTRYMCAGTLTLSAPVVLGTTYSWVVKKGAATVYGPAATGPTGLAVTAGSYEVTVTTTLADPLQCAPANVVDVFEVLPALGITLSSSTASYCGAATTHQSVVTPVTTGFPTGGTFAADLEVEYTYAVTRNGTTVVATDYGTISAANVYTLTTTSPGEYKITTTVKYKQIGTNVLLGTTGRPTTSTTQTITVTAAPAQPVITITTS